MSIWLEIIAATKGKAQLFKSQGWNRLVELWRSQQPEEEPAPEPEEVVDFGVRTGREATRRWSAARTKTLVLREAAEWHEDLGAAQDAVEDLLISGQLDNEIFADMSAEEISLIDDDDVPMTPLDELLAAPPIHDQPKQIMAERRPRRGPQTGHRGLGSVNDAQPAEHPPEGRNKRFWVVL